MTTYLERLIKDSEWRHMNEAPKDREILVYCNDTNESFVVRHMKCIEDDTSMWVSARVWDEGVGQITVGCKPDKWKPLPDDRLAKVCEVLVDTINIIDSFCGIKMEHEKIREVLKTGRSKAEAIAKGDE